MSTRGQRLAAGGISVGVVAAVVAGVFAFDASQATAEPTPTPTVVAPVFDYVTASKEAAAERQATWEAAEAERIAAEAEATRVAAEAARLAAEQEQQRASQQQKGGGGRAPDQPSSPARCPAGSSANSNDGVNDTSCFPNICFSIAVPDPAHPECDVAFRP